LKKLTAWFRASYGVDVRLDLMIHRRLLASESAGTHLYLIAQEAVNNAIKHSQARSVIVKLRTSVDVRCRPNVASAIVYQWLEFDGNRSEIASRPEQAMLLASQMDGSEFMPGIIRRRVAIVAVLYLGPLALDSTVGQASTGAEDRIASYDAAKGDSLYSTYCSACHGANGEGRPGMYPPIKGSGVVTKDDATKHIRVVLNGLQGAKAGGVLYSTPMPPFAATLSDAEIAAVINFERSSWGNHGKLVAAAQIAAQRSSSKIR
jgi:mono/diheme cytochrome c family protein